MLPPSAPYPPLVQAYKFVTTPTEFLDECAARFGPMFRLRLPNYRDVMVTTHPELVKRLFAMSGDEAHAGEANEPLAPMLGRHSVLLLDGKEHMRHRKLLLPPFHGERMHAFGRAMLELTRASVERWPDGGAFALHPHLQRITLEVIVRTVFGVDEGPRFAKLADTLAEALDIAAWAPLMFPIFQKDLGPLSPWGRFLRLRRRATAMMQEEIDRARRAPSGRTDVLAMLAQARDEAGAPMTDEEIQDELSTLLIAGHETTATALAWCLHHLSLDQPLQARLAAELAACGGDPERIARSELAERVVKEALRLRPVVPMVGRVIQAPVSALGYDFPKGTLLACSIYLVHRSPALYPDPGRFDPERFASFRPAPHEYFPFGGGIRRCIGAAFAVYEMKMVLAEVLSRRAIEAVDARVKVVRRAVTFSPDTGVVVRAPHRRLAAQEAA